MKPTNFSNTIIPVEGRIVSTNTLGIDDVEVLEEGTANVPHPNFIESNTQAIEFTDLVTKCIIPTFNDNTLTISHQNFIYSVKMAAEKVFGELTPIECRVSHPINGRIAQAQYKKPQDLRDDEKTLFYQRLAWICHVKNITREINGQQIELTIGGCRSYSDDKLYNKPTPQKFKIFVAWSCRVCSNQMIQCNGNSGTFECMSETDIFQKALELFKSFEPHKEENLKLLANLQTTKISEEQFCKIMGRLRLYQCLSNETKAELNLPDFNIGDQACNKIVQGYVDNPNFGKEEDEDITTWNFLQLANESVKQAYIDRWIDRNQACTDFTLGIQKAIDGEETDYNYEWFLN